MKTDDVERRIENKEVNQVGPETSLMQAPHNIFTSSSTHIDRNHPTHVSNDIRDRLCRESCDVFRDDHVCLRVDDNEDDDLEMSYIRF